MNILVIGQGGREHALIKAFCQSNSVQNVFVAPGNDGMRGATRLPIKPHQTHEIISFCQNNKIDFVFIGPEEPLVLGLSDALRSAGIPVIGPDQAAAQLEGSKIFSKQFMFEAGVPTARATVVSSPKEALQAVHEFTPPYVLKADGLASGKGVFICKTQNALEEACENIFIKKTLGNAGTKALLEQFTPGWELSYLVVTDGLNFSSLPIAQDHKRLRDNNDGPNTGGMGTIAPLQIDQVLREKIDKKIIKPTLAEIQKRGYTYRGILFVGIMVCDGEPFVIEYNVRLGDPETQVILPLVDIDWAQYFLNLSHGIFNPLPQETVGYATCVILAAENYPTKPKLRSPISGTLEDQSQSYFIHAGTLRENGQWLTHGGRVLGCVGLGASVKESTEQAYSLVKKVSWVGMEFRKDIGQYLPRPTKTDRT